MTTNYVPTPPRQAQQRRRTTTPVSKRTLWLVGGGAVTLAIVAVVAGFGLLFMLAMMPDRIASGVAVAGVTVGGKTVTEATTALAQHLPVQTLALSDGSRNWSVSPADLGITIDVNATMNAAQAAAPNTQVTPKYQVDLAKTQTGFIARIEQINIDATTEHDGRSMEIPVMLDRLRVDVTGEVADGVFDLSMISIPALAAETASNYDGPTTTYIVQPGQELGLIAKEYNVSIEDIVGLNGISDPDLIYPGQELTIPAAGAYIPAAPAAPTASGRSIVVSTENQRIYAYQDGQMVRSHLASTGLPDTPTVKGDFKVYVKYTATDMSGPGYYLPQVPYTMYFYQGYGIHGTYWHNAFGRQMSHGCVNLPTEEAQWFFNFAEVGTPVKVI
jgi:lipoprotein-anchoring transpeptidase ErfK/SrfK